MQQRREPRQHAHFQLLASGKPKRMRTRACFFDATVALVEKQGLASTTVQAISREAGFAHGTFYNHFTDRDELIVALVKEVLDPIHEKIIRAAGSMAPGVHRLAFAITMALREGIANEQHAAVLAAALGRYPQITDHVRPPLREDLRAGVAQGDVMIRPSRLLDEQIGSLMGLAFGELLRSHRRKPIIRATAEAILRLLGLPPSRASDIVAKALARTQSVEVRARH